ncbi:MAG: DUF2760 domain-containing protein [Planctomycetes bacterium]|nr:DUF2760 domain-containing protein [Planctomycetota bacterium]
MSRIVLAFRAFFAILFSAEKATQVEQCLLGHTLAQAATTPQSQAATKPTQSGVKPTQATGAEALALLAALQRESRLIDLLKDDISGYSDAQIGAAMRDVHRGAAGVIERIFALRPAVDGAENSDVTVPAGYDAARYRLVGSVSGQPPFTGRLCHHGWQATAVQLPAHTGSADSAKIVAPAEVELR